MFKPSTEKSVFFYKSPIGILEIQLKNKKIYSLSKTICYKNKIAKKSAESSKAYTSVKKSQKSLIQNTILFLDSYFSGNNLNWRESNKPPTYSTLKEILFPRGTDFQKRVWQYLTKIPYGQTRTYGEVAQAIGSPGAARAIGSACARNPYLLLIPCHRVVAGRGLGGFALGLPTKAKLLKHEKNFFKKNQLS